MYVVRGEMVVKKDPETFLGQYGVFFGEEETYRDWQGGEHTDSSVVWAVSTHKQVANFIARGLRRRGTIPSDMEVEHITSLEQADKYARPSKQKVDVAKHRHPDVVELLDRQVPEGAELLEGKAQMWKELRIPTPYIYVAALGKILAEVEFTPETGWQDTHDAITGRSQTFGLLTPVLSLSSSKWETSASDYAPRY